jgi:peptidoglycan/LPS O-acetylase OafA/YrhL
MKMTEWVVQILIWLPALIALSRRCRYAVVIVMLCAAISGIAVYDIHDYLAEKNARHALYLFAAEVLVWLPTFILSIYAVSPSTRSSD